MRVAIEAAPLGISSGGLGRYTSELSLALARCFPADEFYLISDQPFPMPEAPPANLRRGGGPRNAIERRWWLWGIAREMSRLGAELVHGPDFSVPYIPRRPSVLTIHDLSPWMDPSWHHNADRVKRRTPVLLELGVATMIVTPGETVRRQAIERFRLHPGRVVAVPEAAAPWFRPVETEPRRPYFLFVGTLEPRKDIPLLLAAWRAAGPSAGAELLVAGRRRADFPPLPDEAGLQVLGEVADARLPGLYSGALALIYPSRYEGFGLPVLEAMQCGTPVIATRAVREAGGEAAVYAETAVEFAAAMRAIAQRPEWRAELRERSLARAREFTWERTARMTRDVYEEARRRFGD